MDQFSAVYQIAVVITAFRTAQVAQNVFITFYLGCKDVIKKRFKKNIFKTFA